MPTACSKSALEVELRGQLSNRLADAKIDLVDQLLCRPQPTGEAFHPALRPVRQRRIRDRINEDEVAREFVDGAMIKVLGARYHISESSVKRLLRQRGITRTS